MFSTALRRVAGGIVFLSALYALQRPFREYPGVEYSNFPLPPDWQEETEWVFARLMYPSAPSARWVRRYRMGGSDWTQGLTSWTQDYPRADRHFAAELRRLTRIHARSVEQPVNLDDGDDVFDYPWLYAVQVGEWQFYRLPEKETFVQWRERAPADFRFAVKASRYITHVKKLKDCKEPLKMFMDRASGLGKKLGPILFQFPRTWKLDLERLKAFLELLPARYQFAFEFRHSDWLTDPVYAALRGGGAALCLPVGPGVPLVEVVTVGFTYIRMLGGSGDGGSFTENEITRWAGRIQAFLEAGTRAYVYFNNDQHGHAIRNAKRLRELL